MCICRTPRLKVSRARLGLGFAFTYGATILYNAFRKAWLWSLLALCFVNKALIQDLAQPNTRCHYAETCNQYPNSR